jgi:hypothetical protein
MKRKSKIGLSDYQKVVEGLKNWKPFSLKKVNYKLILNIAFHLLELDLNKL